jgi:hypothetical protein
MQNTAQLHYRTIYPPTSIARAAQIDVGRETRVLPKSNTRARNIVGIHHNGIKGRNKCEIEISLYATRALPKSNTPARNIVEIYHNGIRGKNKCEIGIFLYESVC